MFQIFPDLLTSGTCSVPLERKLNLTRVNSAEIYPTEFGGSQTEMRPHSTEPRQLSITLLRKLDQVGRTSDQILQISGRTAAPLWRGDPVNHPHAARQPPRRQHVGVARSRFTPALCYAASAAHLPAARPILQTRPIHWGGGAAIIALATVEASTDGRHNLRPPRGSHRPTGPVRYRGEPEPQTQLTPDEKDELRAIDEHRSPRGSIAPWG